MQIRLTDNKDFLTKEKVIALYKANDWSAASKPDRLMAGLHNSHIVITAWDGDTLVGLGNSISDGSLVVYYPHILVLPSYHGKGIGGMIVQRMHEKYKDFHMQVLTADGKAIDFYTKQGFEIAGETKPMWIYQGKEH
jgi:GNAT superfamily N-acetyltransferase